jgi:hypothetical protein
VADEASRNRQARAAAEQALVRVVHHYGARPEFVVLGGLVPELLCSGSSFQHAGTTDFDFRSGQDSRQGRGFCWRFWLSFDIQGRILV